MIREAKIGIRTISDHAPIAVTMNLLTPRLKSNTWRLNSSLLTDPTLLTKIDASLTEFFQLNDTPDMDPLVLWEVHKCSSRGELINLGSRRKKEQEKEIKNLSKKVFKLESMHKHTLNKQSARELLETRKAQQQILRAKTKRGLFSKRKFTTKQEIKWAGCWPEHGS